MSFRLSDLGAGYSRIEGNIYPTLLVAIDEVAEVERDDLLGLFGHHTIRTLETQRWWVEHVAMPKEDVAMQDLEGYSEMRRKFLESLPLEERLVGLTRDQLIAALPDDVLRYQPDEVLATLSPETRELVRKRIGR